MRIEHGTGAEFPVRLWAYPGSHRVSIFVKYQTSDGEGWAETDIDIDVLESAVAALKQYIERKK